MNECSCTHTLSFFLDDEEDKEKYQKVDKGSLNLLINFSANYYLFVCQLSPCFTPNCMLIGTLFLHLFVC